MAGTWENFWKQIGKPESNNSGKPKCNSSEKLKSRCSGKPKCSSSEKPKCNSSEKPKRSSSGKPKRSSFGKPKRSSFGEPKSSSSGKPKSSNSGKPKCNSSEKPKSSSSGNPKSSCSRKLECIKLEEGIKLDECIKLEEPNSNSSWKPDSSSSGMPLLVLHDLLQSGNITNDWKSEISVKDEEEMFSDEDNGSYCAEISVEEGNASYSEKIFIVDDSTNSDHMQSDEGMIDCSEEDPLLLHDEGNLKNVASTNQSGRKCAKWKGGLSDVAQVLDKMGEQSKSKCSSIEPVRKSQRESKRNVKFLDSYVMDYSNKPQSFSGSETRLDYCAQDVRKSRIAMQTTVFSKIDGQSERKLSSFKPVRKSQREVKRNVRLLEYTSDLFESGSGSFSDYLPSQATALEKKKRKQENLWTKDLGNVKNKKGGASGKLTSNAYNHEADYPETLISNDSSVLLSDEEHSSGKYTKVKKKQASSHKRKTDKFSKIQNQRERSFHCEYCQEAFSSQYYLQLHTMHHTNERPYKCDICNKAFRMRWHLKMHRQIHTEQKPFKCKICGHSNNRKDNLRGHLLNLHQVPHEKVSKFIEKFNLADEVVKLEKHFSCVVCGYKSTRRYNVISHMKRVHKEQIEKSIETLYKEEVKNIDAGVINKIVRLLINNSDPVIVKEKRFSCSICGSERSRRYRLVEHINTVHNQPKEICSEYIEDRDQSNPN